MLIINADDFGQGENATNKILDCFQMGRITSTSAMVFMADSERAARLAREVAIDVGLHLNLDSQFGNPTIPRKLREYQIQIATYLTGGKYRFLFYNPGLVKQFSYVYNAQYEEFVRLYDRSPGHISGHHHMHLCANMLVAGLLPAGAKVRRNFTFSAGQRGIFNRLYRGLVDRLLMRRHLCTDFFFSISTPSNEIIQEKQLRGILNLAELYDVELMVHPERKTEYDYLMGDAFLRQVSEVRRGGYKSL